MKDFEKEMRDLEKQLEKMGERLNEYYSKFGENIAKKYSKDYDGNKEAKVWTFSRSDDADEKKDFSTGGQKGKKSEIEKILPYLDEESLHELVESFISGETDVDMKSALPYLEEEDVSLLIEKLGGCDGEEFNGLTVSDLLPYADDEDIDVLFLKGVKEGKIDKRLMCYVSDDCWHELVLEYCKNEDSKLDIDEIFPYLDEEDIRLIFKTYLKRQKKND